MLHSMVIKETKKKKECIHFVICHSIFNSMLILGLLFLLLIVLTSSAQSYRFEDINTIISFGDSYTTRYIDLSNLTYACRNCTSAGAPNWVVYIEDDTDWVSWDFAASGAPLNNALVHKVDDSNN